MADNAPPGLPPLVDNAFAPEFFADEATGFFLPPGECQHHILSGSRGSWNEPWAG